MKQLLEIEYKGLNIAYKKGLKVALGTDAGSFPWSINQAREFEFLVKKAGFSSDGCHKSRNLRGRRIARPI